MLRCPSFSPMLLRTNPCVFSPASQIARLRTRPRLSTSITMSCLFFLVYRNGSRLRLQLAIDSPLSRTRSSSRTFPDAASDSALLDIRTPPQRCKKTPLSHILLFRCYWVQHQILSWVRTRLRGLVSASEVLYETPFFIS